MDEKKWQGMLDELQASGSGGPFFFIKEGKTRVRLVPEKDEHFFVETTRVFRGKERQRYIVSGVVAGTSVKELSDEWKEKVSPIIIPKTALEGILTLLAEGYDLLGAEGHGITIIRSGKGLETSYTVVPSPKPIPLPEDFKPLEKTLVEYGQEFYQSSLDRDANRGGGDAAPPAETEPAKESSGEDW